MFKHYSDYYWKSGRPQGRHVVEVYNSPQSYKIVVDPYFKRFSIEKYSYQHFDKVVYDSLLLDFRHLTALDQLAWYREIVEEKENQMICLLRNQDDRAVLLETQNFENNLCCSCFISSIHGLLLAKQQMYYEHLNSPFNGVILYDLENRPVMMKVYEVDSLTGEFTTLLNEEWNMQNGIAKQEIVNA